MNLIHGDAALLDQNASLRKERDEARAGRKLLSEQGSDTGALYMLAQARAEAAESRLAALEAENAALREGLSFYADKGNWTHPRYDTKAAPQTISIAWGAVEFKAPAGKALAPALIDHGDRARSLIGGEHG